jgi:hypothetical protein
VTITERAMLRHIIDGPPPLTETERTIAHGRLLLVALYEEDLGKRRAARRAVALLLGMADTECPGAT